jgi:Phage integrase, N-terminal SAM-like domain
VTTTYQTTVLPLLASTTRRSYTGMLDKYLLPAFGEKSLRDLSPLSLQRYFSMLQVRHTTAL